MIRTTLFLYCSLSAYAFSTHSNKPLGPSLLSLGAEADSREALRNEIQELREEAIRRLEKLNEKVAQRKNPALAAGHASTTEKKNGKLVEVPSTVESFAISNNRSIQPNRIPEKNGVALANRDPATLLHDTTWRISLNIGRERGTWMPKTWGVSGQRLMLNLDVRFTHQQLYDREEFLDGIAGARVLEVIGHELVLGPTLTQGSKTIQVRNGGWCIAKGQGPAGTDLLRFYIEAMEEVTHEGADVYCPKGRVYCTCGYFPQQPKQQNSRKSLLKQEQRETVQRIERINADMEQDGSLVSFNKLAGARDLMKLSLRNRELRDQILEAEIRDPDPSLLKFSEDASVGLSREGGVCCKVPKGLTIEYHILGRFSIGSSSRDHSQNP